MFRKTFLFTALAVCTFNTYAQSTTSEYTIAKWQGNKPAAVSVTFDDCMPSQFENAIPVLNDASRKIPATFFLTGNGVAANAASIVNAYRAGHEIANHSFTHPPKLADLSPAEIESELKKCQDATSALFNKQVSFTMAYPNGSGQDTTVKDLILRNMLRKYFIGARATQIKTSRINQYLWDSPFTPDSYYRVNSAMITKGFTVSDFVSDLNEAISKGGWYCATYHGIETGWVITSKALFTSHMDEIIKKKDQLWIATFRDVIAYHKERSSCQLFVIEENRRICRLSLTDSLSNADAYRIPLTILIKNPGGGQQIKSITQAGKKLTYSIKGDTIQFDAMPGAAEILIAKKR